MSVILVAGSLHYDMMIAVPHQPEKGETVLGNKVAYKFGGKGGNQAISAAKHGETVRFVGAVGADAHGEFLISTLKASSVDTTYISVIDNETSGMSVAITDDSGDYAAVVASNSNQLITEDVFESDLLWNDVSLLILQNEISPETNLKAAVAAKKRGVKVGMNAAPITDKNSPVFDYVDLMVVNAVEARDLSEIAVVSLDSAREAAAHLTSKFEQVVVTAGEHGVAFCQQGGNAAATPAIPVELISTHGAGDCFMGALCAEINKNAALCDAVAFANRIAAKHVST
ncbi:ribokinase [Vibrio rhizosphaerae]|uniref:ribokinase n=1 Tax=Vibrio rhizosphaerae TaxID=398736 RepID=UPI0005716036|nr:ribokinase [Vibrio rhizosphaerae]